MDSDVAAAIARIPALRESEGRISIERLGGLTNRNFALTTPSAR